MPDRRRVMGESLTSAGVVNGVIQDDWSKIIKIAKAGRAQDFYNLGDKKPMTLGSLGTFNMQVVGFNCDFRADKKGMANVSFLSEELINQTVEIFSGSGSGYTGWEGSKVRSYLDGTVKNALPSEIKNAILPVFKWHTENPAWSEVWKDQPALVNGTARSVDSVWIPGLVEISTKPEFGGEYRSALSTLEKHIVGTTTAADWPLRDSYEDSGYIWASGVEYVAGMYWGTSNVDGWLNPCFGFCL